MLYILSALVFIIIFTLWYLLMSFFYKDRIQILSRINQIIQSGIQKELSELDTPFRQRIIVPFIRAIEKFITKITPNVMKNKIEQYLLMAGKPIHPYADRWLLFKIAFGFILPIVLFVFIFYNGIYLNHSTVIIMVLLAVMLFCLPELYLMQLARKRKKEIEKTLPDVLDLLTVSVEAGLSFDSAVNKLSEKMSGVISEEFGRALHEIRIGKKRKEALISISKRCNVSDLSIFISSLIQADELGIGIAKILKVQSEQMREKRRQRAQEQAMKAPVKILFPLVFFIFPTIFVIILGPAIIKFTQLMGK